MPTLFGKAISEYIGTALLVCVVVGSGIMATNLSEDAGIALLINTISTIFALVLLIFILAPVSGAHFNPAVSLVQLVTKSQRLSETFVYIVAQVTGAISGAVLANIMFDLAAFQISSKERTSFGMLIGEVIATAGLIAVIGILAKRNQGNLIPIAVATWIGSAYFFTSSTSFANPAVTVGRIFSDTFAGIEPGSVLAFIGAQLVGAAIGLLAVRAIHQEKK
jgi:glycerol uptake facilitator-like aquaporin